MAHLVPLRQDARRRPVVAFPVVVAVIVADALPVARPGHLAAVVHPDASVASEQAAAVGPPVMMLELKSEAPLVS